MPRREGSGFASVQAEACARMFVALARGQASRVKDAIAILDREQALGRCGLTGVAVRQRLEALLARWPEAQGGFVDGQVLNGGLGDLRLTQRDGSVIHVEVKAQTKKSQFRDITQADWVRDGTDFIRHLVATDAAFASDRDHPAIRVLMAGWRPSSLDLGALWAADVGLLAEASKRAEASVANGQQLGHFLQQKWFLHVTQGGARLIRLADIPYVADALNGRPPKVLILPNPQKGEGPRVGLAKIRLEHQPSSGRSDILFTYHLYVSKVDQTILGRHKAHAQLFSTAPAIVV